MSTQDVNFAETGATLDTGEKDAASIRPIVDGEAVTQAVMQRPDENLRHRSEVLRDEVEDSKFLQDADRVLTAQGGGNLLWNGVVSGGGDGKFSISNDLVIKPFLTTLTSTRANATIRGVVFQTQLTGAVVPRAYSGANKISVQLQGSDGAVLAVTVDGTPADNITITLNTNAGAGTTKQQLVDFLNINVAAAAYRNLGCSAALAAGAVGTDKVAPGGVFVGTDFQIFAGAVDAESHVITAAGLVAFFGDSANILTEGDVVAIRYDTMTDNTFGGRRQSIADLPEANTNVDGNLFLVRRFPERLPFALPVATVQDDRLRLLEGTILPKGVVSTLNGGYVSRSGDTMTGALVMSSANVEPAVDNTVSKLGTTAKRFVEANAVQGNFNNVQSTAAGLLGDPSSSAKRYIAHLQEVTVYGSNGVKANSNALPLGDATHRFTASLENITVYGSSFLPNVTGQNFGSSSKRWAVFGTSGDFSTGLNVVGHTNVVDLSLSSALNAIDIFSTGVLEIDRTLSATTAPIASDFENQFLHLRNLDNTAGSRITQYFVHSNVGHGGFDGWALMSRRNADDDVDMRWGYYTRTGAVADKFILDGVNSAFKPAVDNTGSLGLAGAHWGAAHLGTTTMYGRISPNADGTTSLGNVTSTYFQDLAIKDIYAKGQTQPSDDLSLNLRNSLNNVVAQARFLPTGGGDPTFPTRSWNIASITRQGVGHYRITLNTAVNSATCSVHVSPGDALTSSVFFMCGHNWQTADTVLDVYTVEYNTTGPTVGLVDNTAVSVTIIGSPKNLTA